jgi:Family of unknown function (DUF6941)
MSLLAATMLACERILHESDGVVSAIRIIDILTFTPSEEVPIERQRTPVHVLARVLTSADDEAEHVVRMSLVRPDGKRVEMGEAFRGAIPPPKVAGVPRGLTINAQIDVVPTEGTHWIVASFDGEDVSRTPLSVRLNAPPETR